jgi:hypothetical protein
VFGWWQDYVDEIGWLKKRELSLDQRGPQGLVRGALDAPQTQDAIAIAGSLVTAAPGRCVFDVVGASIWAAPRVDSDGAAPRGEHDRGNHTHA